MVDFQQQTVTDGSLQPLSSDRISLEKAIPENKEFCLSNTQLYVYDNAISAKNLHSGIMTIMNNRKQSIEQNACQSPVIGSKNIYAPMDK